MSAVELYTHRHIQTEVPCWMRSNNSWRQSERRQLRTGSTGRSKPRDSRDARCKANDCLACSPHNSCSPETAEETSRETSWSCFHPTTTDTDLYCALNHCEGAIQITKTAGRSFYGHQRVLPLSLKTVPLTAIGHLVVIQGATVETNYNNFASPHRNSWM